MKKTTTIFAILIASLGFAQVPNSVLEQNATAIQYGETITVEDLKEDLTILASDALEGRETGKRGQKMAAAYIKAHFEELGLEGPVKGTGSPYYQDVPLKTSKAGTVYLKVNDLKLKNIEDFLYYGTAYNAEEVSAELIFAGGGTATDLKDLDVKDKVVLIHTTDRNIRQEALKTIQENGGKMLLVVYQIDNDGYQVYHDQYAGYFSKESFGLDKGENKAKAGIMFLSPDTAATIFNTSFEKLQKAIANANNGKKNALKKIKSVEISYKIEYDDKKIISENVLGYLEGSDLKDEVLVITSHYDHLGLGENGEIFNGADDDGSGTVAVMDIAEAFVKAKADGHGPRRSILFMTVTAEEKGLLGSEYYADNPIFPLENTVADLNIDMIGRIDDRELKSESYVSLVGADKLSSELHEISEKANSTYTNLFLDYTYNDEDHPERIYYRSDHWNFAKNGIPVIFYTTGSHPDYHKPTDTVDRIEFELMAKRTKLIFYTAWEIVNRDGRLKVDNGLNK